MATQVKIWTMTTNELPPEGVEVDTISDGGIQQTLWRFGNLWFIDSARSMYCYYTPQAWRFLDSSIN